MRLVQWCSRQLYELLFRFLYHLQECFENFFFGTWKIEWRRLQCNMFISIQVRMSHIPQYLERESYDVFLFGIINRWHIFVESYREHWFLHIILWFYCISVSLALSITIGIMIHGFEESWKNKSKNTSPINPCSYISYRSSLHLANIFRIMLL